jgi:hypothetical protein
LHKVDEHSTGCLGQGQIHHPELAARQLKRLLNALFFNFTDTLDDLEPQSFIKTNAPFEIRHVMLTC